MSKKAELEKAWNEAARELADAREECRKAEHKKHLAAEKHRKAKNEYLTFVDRENGLTQDDDND